MNSKLIPAIFCICLAMGGLVVAILLAPETPFAGGSPHPGFPGMVSGGDGEARLMHIGSFAFVFQSLLLLLIGCLCSLGVSEKNRSWGFWGYMAASYGLAMFIWWQMYSGHQAFLQTGEVGYFMGFPIPTAWQMYGTWFSAIPSILLYALGFRKYIYSEADEKTFQAVLAEHKVAQSE
ncbi:MAG: hypothetical protein AB8B95_13690 [Pseudohongiellaceae bacterium]